MEETGLEPWPGVTESHVPAMFERLDRTQVEQVSSEMTRMFTDRYLFRRVWVLINTVDALAKMIDPRREVVAYKVTALIKRDAFPFDVLGAISAWEIRESLFAVFVSVMQWFWSQSTPEDERDVISIARSNTLSQIASRGMSFGHKDEWMVERELHEMVFVLLRAVKTLRLERVPQASFIFNSEVAKPRFLWHTNIQNVRLVTPIPWVSAKPAAEESYWE